MIRRRKPIARKTPIKRKRSKPRRSERVRDPVFMAWIREEQCFLAGHGRCEGRTEADHAEKRCEREESTYQRTEYPNPVGSSGVVGRTHRVADGADHLGLGHGPAFYPVRVVRWEPALAGDEP